MNDYSIIVVGGGHAGLEAAMATAKMNQKTLLITLNIKMMGNLPCNPSIGGSAKGIVVREIDALGGIMAVAADHTYLQMKMLNTGKGPAVQCLRAQSDKLLYPSYVQNLALNSKNLTVIEGHVIDLLYDDYHVYGVKLSDGRTFKSQAVILTTGTYMEAQVLRGHTSISAGPDGEKPSIGLSKNLEKMGLELFRLKTGTPPRVKKSSIDFSKMIPQPGSKQPYAFSYITNHYVPLEEQVLCHLIYTTPQTHQLINEHLDDSSMFSGLITGVGPRYCPSIEDKVVRFSDKSRHQLFIEPESSLSESMYLQGFSTSMPIEIQDKMVRSLPGLEHAEILKYAYAIEYDALVPTQFDVTLMAKKWPGLYGAGQIVGTSGYEEAAGLGLLAGINAVLKIQDKPPLILRRDQAYIGVMIDDLITKGTSEPYRLLSSRAEYRLLLRHDNADLRLLEIGYEHGLIDQSRYDQFKNKLANIDQAKSILNSHRLVMNDTLKEDFLAINSPPFEGGILAIDLLKRPEITYAHLQKWLKPLGDIPLDKTAINQLEVMIKFEGYIDKQIRQAQRLAKQEKMLIPKTIDYQSMDGLAIEARQKLSKIRPISIGQASRISGVNPSDIAMLILYLKKGQHDEQTRI